MAGPKSDVILARLHGSKVEYTGVVAGMSGSPVYIDGKLVGAIAYRIGEFSKEPIAGITPAASMMEINEMDKTPSPEIDAAKAGCQDRSQPYGRPGTASRAGQRRRKHTPTCLSRSKRHWFSADSATDTCGCLASSSRPSGVVPVMGAGSVSD